MSGGTTCTPTPTTSRSNKRKRRCRRRPAPVKSTPWKDGWEWNSVGQGLLQAMELLQHGRIVTIDAESTNNDHLKRSLQLVQVWKERSSQPLPHAIECSASLAQLLHDDATTTNSSSSSSSSLPLGYATAIIRSVNGLADRLQQRRKSAAPVSALCQSVGLPGWIVDLRHASSHNELPSMCMLRLAAHTLLGFFGERYWKVTREQHFEIQEDAARALLQAYRVDMMTGGGSGKTSAAVAVAAPTADEEEDYETAVEEDDHDDEDAWLGTNFFAALHTSKSKKKARPLTPSTPAEEPKQQQVVVKKDPMENALRFVQKTPLDVAYDVALEFLLWGSNNNDSDTGLLFGDQKHAVIVVQPLLRLLFRSWPGFCTTFLTHCVEYRLQHKDNDDDYLLMNQVVADVLKDSGDDISQKLPITTWCKRLPDDCSLRKVLLIVQSSNKSNNDPQNEAAAAQDNKWSIVDSWEPCTIGTLPGHAV